MGRLKDNTGEIYGRLTVIRKVPAPSPKPGRKKRTEAFWECACSCGNVKVVAAPNLHTGNTTSCGCLHKEKLAERNRQSLTMDPWEVDMRLYIRKLGYRKVLSKLGTNQFKVQLKDAAESYHPGNGEQWSLSLEVYKQLVMGVCYYCGAQPAGVVRGVAGGDLRKNGIDRVDNSRGYEESNCVSCCIICNRDKGTKPVSTFIEVTRRRYEWLRIKKLIAS